MSYIYIHKAYIVLYYHVILYIYHSTYLRRGRYVAASGHHMPYNSTVPNQAQEGEEEEVGPKLDRLLRSWTGTQEVGPDPEKLNWTKRIWTRP